MRLWLASASPRRRELLAALGLSFEVRAADVDESLHPGEAPADYVQRLARHKALSVREALAEPSGAVVLGSDTSVVVDGEVLGKPGRDAELHAAMLRKLAGRAHQVLTAVALAAPGGVHQALSTTTVHFAPLSEAQVRWYVATGEGEDKAGGYASQARAGAFITRVEGSTTGVIGLPLAETVGLLHAAGVPLPWSR
jgi:septum formation protein